MARWVMCAVVFLVGLSLPLSALAQDGPEFGLHWFDAANTSTDAVDGGFPVEVGPQFYDPSKPTLIYFHGWQNNMIGSDDPRETFRSRYDDTNFAPAWKEGGWNIGIFYWTAFADEDNARHAENKIWTADSAQRMRYRLEDRTYSEEGAPSISAGDLAIHEVAIALASNTSGHIRFVGHSLGNQMATRTAWELHQRARVGEVSHGIVPERLDLLDPFWSNYRKDYLDDRYSAEVVYDHISELIAERDVAVTWYKTSPILDLRGGHQNHPLRQIVAFQEHSFRYLGWTSDIRPGVVANKHGHAKFWYWWSYGVDAPVEERLVRRFSLLKFRFKSRIVRNRRAASAQASNERIRAMMGSVYHWVQIEGRDTPVPDDDVFERRPFEP